MLAEIILKSLIAGASSTSTMVFGSSTRPRSRLLHPSGPRTGVDQAFGSDFNDRVQTRLEAR